MPRQASTVAFDRVAGQVDKTSVDLSPVDKYSSGIQLDVKTPDAATTNALQDVYGSMYNGGTGDLCQCSAPGGMLGDGSDQAWTWDLTDQNETGQDTSESMFQGIGLGAGVEAPDPVAAVSPMTPEGALRDKVSNILGTTDAQGQTNWDNPSFGDGYGPATDQELYAIVSAYSYLTATGDMSAAREWIAPIQRILDNRFLANIKANGLFTDPVPTSTYYYNASGMTAGYNTGLNAFGFEALRDAADIEQALGDRSRAAGYRADASSLKEAINRNLWDPNGPGGPQYTDLLGYDGSFNDYFIDMYQYPLIAFGIAPRDRAAEMLTTADNRMAQLVAQYGYTRAASLSTLWDNPNSDGGPDTFPGYANGGSILEATYWEIVARAKMGDVNGQWGAYNLLKGFAQLAQSSSLIGDNAATIQGVMGNGDGEPWLSDGLDTVASLVNGILGINERLGRLAVKPHLPAGWKDAVACITYKGRIYEITDRGNGTHTTRPASAESMRQGNAANARRARHGEPTCDRRP